MIKRLLDWLSLASTIRWLLLTTVIFTVGFELRSRALGSDLPTPDSRRQGYSVLDIEELWSAWGESGRGLYVITQLTMDMIFPLVYGALLVGLVFKFFAGRWRSALLMLPLLCVVGDWTENLLASSIFSGQDLSTQLVPACSWATQGKWLLLLLSLVAVGVGAVRAAYKNWVQVADTVEGWVRMRYPCLSLLFLVAWAPMACFVGPLQSVAANVLLAEDIRQILLLAIINGLAVIFSIAIWRLLAHRLHQARDPGYQTHPWSWRQYGETTLMSAITPLIVFHYSYTQADVPNAPPTLGDWLTVGPQFSATVDYGLAILIVALGITISFAVMAALGRVRSLLLGTTTQDENFFPFENRERSGVLNESVKRRGSDTQLAFYFLLLFVAYFGWLKPDDMPRSPMLLSIPAYVVILVSILTMALSRLSAWLDTTRVPVLLLVVLWVILIRSVTSHYPELPTERLTDDPAPTTLVLRELLAAEADLASAIVDRDDARQADAQRRSEARQQELEDAAWQAVSRRMEKVRRPTATPDKIGKTLVIVTCPGGGIHAAAWAAHVLEQLDRRYSDFADSIALISGVSGGSVGTMFYVNSRYPLETEPAMLDGKQWLRAAESSLGAIGAGLAFDDGPALLYPPLASSDRGVRLEHAWRHRLLGNQDDQTLQRWGERAIQGKMPVVVLNATDAASGRRILFGSLPTPRRLSLNSKVARPWDCRELFESATYDLHLTTAARASASFPYVSPFTRPARANALGRTVGIGDGGYVDNEGIVTAVDWLDFIGRRAAKAMETGPIPFRRILLLRIQPGSDGEALGEPDARALLSSLRWLSGPLEALASMRTSSQIERGQLEVDLASTYVDARWWEETLAPSTNARLSVGPPSKHVSSIQKGQMEIYERSNNAMIQMAQPSQSEASFRPQQPASAAQSDDSQATPPPPDLDDLPTSQAFVGEVAQDWVDYPVLILPLPFTSAEPDRAIPLNWKLSPRQKHWYPAAWQSLLDREADFFTELDILFEKRIPEEARD